MKRVLDDLQQAAREQLAAAWTLHVERVEQQLRAGWREQIERVIEDRFLELETLLARSYSENLRGMLERELALARRQERSAAVRGLSARLNQSVRRILQSRKQEEWTRALLDATEGFRDRAILFTVQDAALRMEGARGMDGVAMAGSTGLESAPARIPLTAAPAFAAVVESGDPVVVLAVASELSETVADQFAGAQAEDGPGGRVSLFPVNGDGRVVAVLCAAGSPEPDSNALEMLCSAAGLVWALRARTAAPSNSLVTLAARPAAPPAPAWEKLDRQEQELHLRAQRFARVQVAEMRLYKAEAVQSGRANRNLYAALRQEIDAARESYRADFTGAGAAMVDYLHLELVRTLANDDAELLGADYPGPLV